MNIRIVTLGGDRPSRVKTIALAVAALAIGGIFLAFGIALIASLAVVGAVVGAGLALSRVLRGRSLPPRERPLDPSMEVFPPATGEARRIQDRRDAR